MLKHQYRGDGWHRIVSLDHVGFLKKAGEWTGYQNIATFTDNVNDRGIKTYMAVTDYFTGGCIIADRIYEVESAMDLDAGSEKPPKEVTK